MTPSARPTGQAPPRPDEACVRADTALVRAFELLGKRWTGVVLGTLSGGPAGFRALARAVDGISDSMLSDRLGELGEAGLVTRTVTEGPPLSVTYALTDAGRALLPALEQITRWSEQHLPHERQPGTVSFPRHRRGCRPPAAGRRRTHGRRRAPRLGTDRAGASTSYAHELPRDRGRMGVRGVGMGRSRSKGGDLVGTPDPGEPLHGGGRPAELAEHRGVITTTVVSGLIAVAVAAAEWTGSGRALDTPTGILWSVVALLGVVAMLVGIGLEVRRRRQVEPAVPARTRRAARSAAAPTAPGSATDRDGDLPVHRHRGLHPAAAGAGRPVCGCPGRHAAIVRHAIQAGGGVEVNTEGDSFFAAFRSPVGAVRAAFAAQRGLAEP